MGVSGRLSPLHLEKSPLAEQEEEAKEEDDGVGRTGEAVPCWVCKGERRRAVPTLFGLREKYFLSRPAGPVPSLAAPQMPRRHRSPSKNPRQHRGDARSGAAVIRTSALLPWGFSPLGKRGFLEGVVLGVVPARFRQSQQRSYLSSIAFLSLQRGCGHALTTKSEGLCGSRGA